MYTIATEEKGDGLWKLDLDEEQSTEKKIVNYNWFTTACQIILEKVTQNGGIVQMLNSGLALTKPWENFLDEKLSSPETCSYYAGGKKSDSFSC